jgi:DHA3 family macrolide efflux protein-like MFS transporter
MSWLRDCRDFVIIWTGLMISAVGSGLSTFALGLWVLRETGSTTQFALTFLATALPAIAVSPLAGAVADRYDRRQIMIISDFASAAVTFALAALLMAGHLDVWHVYVGVGASALFDAFRSPAFAASIPQLVPRERLENANAVVQTANAVAAIVSPLLAGAMVGSLSFAVVLAVDGATFVAGLVTLLFAAIPKVVRVTRAANVGALVEALAGWRYVQQSPGLVGLLAIYATNYFVFAMACVLIAPLLLTFATPAMLGVQYAIGGVGLFLGGLLVTALGGPKKRINGVLGYSALGGLALAVHGLRPSFTLVTVAGFVLFLTMPTITSSSTALWQTKVPLDLQGRCFAIQHLVFHVVTALGYLLAGPLSDLVFEPALSAHGVLAGSIGALIGVGPGRGIALMFILLGATMSTVAIAAARVPAIRHVDGLPDATVPVAERSDSKLSAGVPQEAT